MNIACHLIEQSQERPYQCAIVFPEGRDANGRVAYTQLTFKQLNEESDRFAQGFVSFGIGRGCRTVLMVRPSLEFFSLTFALFKAGAVPVMIDPGMGRARLLECIRDVEPEALIGVPQAHLARILFPKYFRTVKRFVTVGRRWFWSGATLDDVREKEWRPFPLAETRADETAAILFTTGSTGPAKGVVYEHGMFDAQIRWIQSRYGIEGGESDLPAFPLFALFSCAMGMTCVIPDMDPTRPARVDPRKIVEAIENHGCTNAFGSPAIWNRVSQYCVEKGVRLPTLRRVLMAGAPVSPEILERMRRALGPGADCHTPYGATEALPVATISGSEVLDETAALSRRGAGTCVGRPFDGIDLRIVRITDDPIERWDNSLVVPQGEIGEIVVKGNVVTKEYFNKPAHTRLAKIPDGADIWHRMGDAGYLDGKGRLWFCGRKDHRVVCGDRTLFSVPCEAIFNQHPDVFRSALVGVGPRGRQRPVIIIEPREGKMPPDPASRERFIAELLKLSASNDLTKDITVVLFHPAFPTDIRHNAKIFRERLAVWAAGRI